MGARERLAARARVIVELDGGVPSPCLSVCRMDPASEWCEGCFRTLDEIAAWGRMSDDAKREVWQAIVARVENASLAHGEGDEDA
ncbi:MAG: hypothetical protein JWP43_2762 [Ramlibacter sp.]|jgi:predicted Fe-S protein YdhL (DUF1289 family)|nr:hypothetical protein [Ramlibacter sp.]